MKSFFVLVCVLGFVLSAGSSFGAEFSWPMFVPATTGAGLCDAQNIERCRNEADCLSFGGYWFNDQCNSFTCSDIAGCYSGTMSDNCPGYWVGGKIGISIGSNCSFASVSQYGVKVSGTITARQGNVFSGTAQTDANGCGQFSITCTDNGTSISCNYRYATGQTGSIINARQGDCIPANRFLTETLAGSWRFNYAIGSSPFVQNYSLDVRTVEEYPAGSGEFVIYGKGQYDNPVAAEYLPDDDMYALLDPGSIIDRLYNFNYTNTNSVSGCYYMYSHSSGTWSNCYPMTGTRTSTTTRALSVAKDSDISMKEEQQLLKEAEGSDEQGNDQLTDTATIEWLNSLRDRLVAE